MDKSSAAEKPIPTIEDNGKSLCAESYQSNEQPPHKRFGDKDVTDPKAQSERQKTFQKETAQVNGTLRIDDNIYDIRGGSLYRRLPGNADKYSGEIKTNFEVNLNSGNKIDLKGTEHTVLMQFTNLLEPARKHRLINNGKSGLVDVNAVMISSLTNLPASNRAIKEYVSNSPMTTATVSDWILGGRSKLLDEMRANATEQIGTMTKQVNFLFENGFDSKRTDIATFKSTVQKTLSTAIDCHETLKDLQGLALDGQQRQKIINEAGTIGTLAVITAGTGAAIAVAGEGAALGLAATGIAGSGITSGVLRRTGNGGFEEFTRNTISGSIESGTMLAGSVAGSAIEKLRGAQKIAAIAAEVGAQTVGFATSSAVRGEKDVFSKEHLTASAASMLLGKVVGNVVSASSKSIAERYIADQNLVKRAASIPAGAANAFTFGAASAIPTYVKQEREKQAELKHCKPEDIPSSELWRGIDGLEFAEHLATSGAIAAMPGLVSTPLTTRWSDPARMLTERRKHAAIALQQEGPQELAGSLQQKALQRTELKSSTQAERQPAGSEPNLCGEQIEQKGSTQATTSASSKESNAAERTTHVDSQTPETDPIQKELKEEPNSPKLIDREIETDPFIAELATMKDNHEVGDYLQQKRPDLPPWKQKATREAHLNTGYHGNDGATFAARFIERYKSLTKSERDFYTQTKDIAGYVSTFKEIAEHKQAADDLVAALKRFGHDSIERLEAMSEKDFLAAYTFLTTSPEITNYNGEYGALLALQCTNTFGAEWKKGWLAMGGRGDEVMAGHLPAGRNEDLGKLILENAHRSPEELRTLARRWQYLAVPERLGDFSDVLRNARLNDFGLISDIEFANECANHPVSNYLYRQLENRYIVSQDTPSPFPTEKSWTDGELTGRFLKRNDPRGLFLDRHVGENQDNATPRPFLNEMATGLKDRSLIHGQESPHGGLFVVEDRNGKVLSYSSAWVSDTGGVCFNEITSAKNGPPGKQILNIFELASNDLLDRFHTVTAGAHAKEILAANPKLCPASSAATGKLSPQDFWGPRTCTDQVILAQSFANIHSAKERAANLAKTLDPAKQKYFENWKKDSSDFNYAIHRREMRLKLKEELYANLDSFESKKNDALLKAKLNYDNNHSALIEAYEQVTREAEKRKNSGLISNEQMNAILKKEREQLENCLSQERLNLNESKLRSAEEYARRVVQGLEEDNGTDPINELRRLSQEPTQRDQRELEAMRKLAAAKTNDERRR